MQQEGQEGFTEKSIRVDEPKKVTGFIDDLSEEGQKRKLWERQFYGGTL